jgi:hypothetical protein
MNNLALTLYAQGDLPGAREIWEQVMSVRRRVLGEEHPDTVLTAWNLFCTLCILKDEKGAMPVFTAYLVPLLQRDPATLSAGLRKIQSMLQRRSEPRP